MKLTSLISLFKSGPLFRGLILLFFIFFSANLNSQNTNNEQVKRLQRSIYIYNFAQQVQWENDDFKTFKIGVLGKDRTVLDLKALSQKRQIQNKPVSVVQFNIVKDIKDVQLLYVNNKLNFNIRYILSKIANKNILLITEDYEYNSSMVNIVNVGDSFEYEINSRLIEKEGLKALPSLRNNAISSAEKWKNLYKVTEESLNEAIKTTDNQKDIIHNKEDIIQAQKEEINYQGVKIDTFEKAIENREKYIEELNKISDFQKKKYEDKVIIERELEKNIKEQIDLLNAQEETIKNSSVKIKEQSNFLENQNAEILEKEAILSQKNTVINKQRNFNILLLALVGLALLTSYVIYRSYLNKKKLNQSLKNKNEEIEKQSRLLISKNKELEEFAYITSHDLKEPLITISGLIDLLIEDYGDKLDEDGLTSLNFINESSIRMKDLIDALLAYSRLGKSKAFETINTNKLLDNLQADLSNVIGRTNAEIIKGDLPIIKGSKIELRLLFQNLITNGIKFIDSNWYCRKTSRTYFFYLSEIALSRRI